MTDDNLSCDCSGAPAEDTLSHVNPPGRSALLYRLGTHRNFRRRLLAALASQPPSEGSPSRPLAALDTRAGDDPAIALLDAWAVTLDVLTFYQERLANEGFLRTATERRSVLELARDVGYELAPGVAATALLAFTVEEGTISAVVPKGAQVQSLPGQDQLPQTFETSDEIETRAEWNALVPRQTRPQELAINEKGALRIVRTGAAPRELFFEGTSTNLKVGDVLLFEQASAAGAGSAVATAVVRAVDPQSSAGRTRVVIDLDAARPPLAGVTIPDTPVVNVFAMRQRVGFFGNTAPPFKDTLPPANPPTPKVPPPSLAPQVSLFPVSSLTVAQFTELSLKQAAINTQVNQFNDNLTGFLNSLDALWLNEWRAGWATFDWDNGLTIWQRGDRTTPWPGGMNAFLDRVITDIAPESWVVFKDPGSPATAAVPFRVDQVVEASVADFTISGRGTGLRLRDAAGKLLPAVPSDPFHIRTSTAFAQSEPLALVELPIPEAIDKGALQIELDHAVLGLRPGQPVWISGDRDGEPGVKSDEVVFLTGASVIDGVTRLILADPLRASYDRTKTTLNANVAIATHGETAGIEVIGSGDASQANQRFALQRPDVTHLSAPTESGAASTVSIRVSGVPWREVPSLHDQDGNAQVFTLSIDDDHRTTVTFGDGVNGARLPTGTENVVASYRTSITADGALGPGTLTLLQTRPLGISRVTNPLATTGGEGPDSLEEGRVNAPFAVRTLGRIVTLQDYEDFARAFGGIGKAKAAALVTGGRLIVHITAVTDHGDTVDPHSELHTNLLKALGAVADPAQEVRVDGADVRTFRLDASLVLDRRRLASEILGDARAALLAAFSLARRDLGQSVAPSEIIDVLQRVPGVIAALLHTLARAGEAAPARLATLAARPARLTRGRISPAEMILIDPNGVVLSETDQ